MTTTVFQLPVRNGSARQIGGRLFRKQVLPADRTVTYQGRTLRFVKDGESDPDRDVYSLRDLAANFDALDQVPFVLADDKNRHSDSPERFRGEVKGFEVADDGLDAIIKMTEDGAKVIRDNPSLGVSARLVKQLAEWGPRKVPAIAHVCGTLLPHIPGLRGWQAIVSDLTPTYDAGQVIDLTAATYEGTGMDATAAATFLEKLVPGLRKQGATQLADDLEARIAELRGGTTTEQTATTATTADLTAAPADQRTESGAVILDTLDNGTQIVFGTEAELYPEPDEDVDYLSTGPAREIGDRIRAARATGDDDAERAAMLEMWDFQSGTGRFA